MSPKDIKEDKITVATGLNTKKVEVELEPVEYEEDDDETESNYKAPNTGRQLRRVDQNLIDKARALYISTEKSIDQISLEVNVNKHTLHRYSRIEKWSLLKQNPEFNSWSRELVDEVYSSINFFTDSKNIMHSLLLREEYQNPKDIKVLVEAFKMADERTTNLRLLRENMNKGDSENYEE